MGYSKLHKETVPVHFSEKLRNSFIFLKTGKNLNKKNDKL